MKQYGHFREDEREFVITTPNTPRHWYNYLWNDTYITFTSQVGYGEGFIQDDEGRRIPMVSGRQVYMLDKEAGEHWTANGLPVEKGYENMIVIMELATVKFHLHTKGLPHLTEFLYLKTKSRSCGRLQ